MKDADGQPIPTDPLPWWARFFTAVVPTHSASERTQYNWRVRIAFVACAAFFGSGFLLAAYIQFPQVNDIVRETEMQEHIRLEQSDINELREVDATVRQQSSEQWALQLDAQIVQLRKDQCRLLKINNREAASAIFDKIRAWMSRYVTLTGQQYQLPSCDDV